LRVCRQSGLNISLIFLILWLTGDSKKNGEDQKYAIFLLTIENILVKILLLDTNIVKEIVKSFVVLVDVE